LLGYGEKKTPVWTGVIFSSISVRFASYFRRIALLTVL
jgi:hypothetical protein